jgi:hypothetical protein
MFLLCDWIRNTQCNLSWRESWEGLLKTLFVDLWGSLKAHNSESKEINRTFNVVRRP